MFVYNIYIKLLINFKLMFLFKFSYICQSIIQWKSTVIVVMKLNTVAIGAILILDVNMLHVHYSKIKVWDALTLGGLIRRAPNGKKTSSLSSTKRMRSLEPRYITWKEKQLIRSVGVKKSRRYWKSLISALKL